jgi:Flp pilus assembly protein TadG
MTGPRHRARAWDGDRGSMTTEFVVLAPIVIAIVLLVVGLGRYAHGRQLVEQAAAAAARAASLTASSADAQTRAARAAAGSLSDAGLSCTGITADVDTGSFRPGGVVTVTITCTADLSGLALSGLPGTATVRATGRAPLEAHRQIATPWDQR